MTPRIYLSAPHMGGREKALVADVFESNWIAPTGPMVTEFEAQLSSLSGIAHVAALTSGTAALHLALRESGIGPGDEVWLPTMTFIGGVAPIAYLGATPRFFDVEPDYFLFDLGLLESELESGAAKGQTPKVVVTTDLYGHVIDRTRMRRLADRFEFVWISDAAEAVGAYADSVHAGKGADYAVFSFNGNKIITTSGGGALASDSESAIARARFLSTQARDDAPHYEHSEIGYNYRLSNVCAAIGVGQLEVLEERVNRRRAINALYQSRLGAEAGFSFTGEPDGMRANRWLTTVTIDPRSAGVDREAVRLELWKHAIESRPLWKPMHMQPVFADVPRVAGGAAEKAFDNGLCLPSGSAMSDDEVNEVCDIVSELVRSR